MKTLSAVLAMLALVSVANAQPVNCNAQWSRLNDLLTKTRSIEAPIPGLIRQTANGGCRTNGVRIPAGDHVRITAQSLSWSGRDLERFARDGLPPTALSIGLKGITISPDIGDPVYSYLQGIQARGSTLDLAVNLDWDAQKNALQVVAIRLSMPEEDYVELQAEIEGVDLTSASTMQVSLGSFALTEATLKIRSQQMFQDYLLLPLGLAVLEGAENPEEKVNELRALADMSIDQAPDQIVPPASKSALKALVQDLPEPRGTLTIAQNASPGIGPARFLPFVIGGATFESLDDIWQVLGGVTLNITYDTF